MLWVFGLFTIALIAIFAPYLLGRSEAQLDEMDASLDIRLKQLKRDFQFQTKELKRRLESGDLAQSEWERLTDELKKETAISLAGTEKAAEKGNVTQIPVMFAVLVAFAASVAYASYSYVGFQDDQINQSSLIKYLKDNPQAIENLRNKLRENPNQENINDLYLALRSQVDLYPENINAWQDLTFFNASYGREDEAMATLRVAMRKHPESLDLKVDKAQLLTVSSDSQQIIEGHRIIAEVLEQDPNHQGALLIRGDSAFRIGMYDLAIKTWQMLRTLMSSNPQMIKALDDRITMANERMSGGVITDTSDSIQSDDSSVETENVTTDSVAPLDNSNRPGVSVAIQIAPEFIDRLDGNEDIFIFARAVSGPPFPIAAIKTKVGDLMGPVDLNDSQAMQEQFTMSKYDEIVVTARISFSGSPTAVSGDIQGTTTTITRPFPAEPIKLLLDQVLE